MTLWQSIIAVTVPAVLLGVLGWLVWAVEEWAKMKSEWRLERIAFNEAFAAYSDEQRRRMDAGEEWMDLKVDDFWPDWHLDRKTRR